MKCPRVHHHRHSGKARVRLNGRDIYLGPWKSDPNDRTGRRAHPDLVKEVERLWALAILEQPLPTNGEFTINGLIGRFMEHVGQPGRYTQRPGKTSQIDNFKDALRQLQALYGPTPAKDFGPLRLHAVRESLLQHRKRNGQPLARRTINQRVGRIREMFNWAVGEELVSLEVAQSLSARYVKPLRPGQTVARETGKVKPVHPAHVRAIRPYVTQPVWDMVRLMYLTGMRPEEVVAMRPCDIVHRGHVWEYSPPYHKTERHEVERVIYLGPRARRILQRYIEPMNIAAWRSETPVFCPRKARPDRKCGQRIPGEHYRISSIRNAVHRACDRAGTDRWTPMNLRHTAASRARRIANRHGIVGLDVAQSLLGHTDIRTTQIYAEQDASLSRAYAAMIG